MNNKLSEQTYPEGIVPHETWNFQDSSKISTFQTCPRKYFFTYVLGLGWSTPNHDLVFGSAWHEAMERLLKLYWANDKSYDEAFIKEALKAFTECYRQDFDELTDLEYDKNPGRAEIALQQYIKKYADDDFNVLGIEQYFKIFLSNEHLLVGKLDAIIENANGDVEVLEHKTTKWTATVWAEQWSNKIQINNYSLIAYVLYEKYKGIIINGAKFFPKNNDFQRVYIRKGVHALEDALTNVTYWMDLIRMNFQLLAESDPNSNSLKAFPKNGESCIKYNRTCPFKAFCDDCYNPIAEKSLIMLRRNFDTVWWDPIETHETMEIKL